MNIDRLKEYRSRLVVFPRKAGKPKRGDATVSILAELKYGQMLTALQGDDLTAYLTREALPVTNPYESEAPRAIEADEKEFNAYSTLREARADKRHEGARKKREAAKAVEENAKAK